MECSSVSDWLLINNVTDLGIFLWIGWNSTKFDLLIFKDSLFAHNQEWTLLSSLLRLLSSMLIFLCLRNKLARSILLSQNDMIVHHRVTPWHEIRQDGEKCFLPKNTTQTRRPLNLESRALTVRPVCASFVKKCSSKNSRSMHSFCLYVRIASNPDGWKQTPSRL